MTTHATASDHDAFIVIDAALASLDAADSGQPFCDVQTSALHLMAALAELIAVVATPPQGAVSIDAASRTVEVRYEYLLTDIDAASRAAEAA